MTGIIITVAVMATAIIIVTTDMGMATGTMVTSSIGAITTTGGTIITVATIMTGILTARGTAPRTPVSH